MLNTPLVMVCLQTSVSLHYPESIVILYIQATFNAAKEVLLLDWQQSCSLSDTQPQHTNTSEIKQLVR